jgi:hypothetical protein
MIDRRDVTQRAQRTLQAGIVGRIVAGPRGSENQHAREDQRCLQTFAHDGLHSSDRVG